MRQTGTVLRYRSDAGYGFIQTPNGESVFFHIKQVRGSLLLHSGDAVAFTVVPSKKFEGKAECCDVELISRATSGHAVRA